MDIHEARCTSCGANLKVEPHKHTIQCDYCQNTILAKNAIELALVEVDKTKDIAKFRLNLNEAVLTSNYPQMLRLSSTIKDIIPDDFESNYFYSYATLKLTQPKEFNQFLKNPPEHTPEDLEKVTSHLIDHSSVRDHSKVQSFVEKYRPDLLQRFIASHQERINIEQQYTIVKRDVFICYSSEQQSIADLMVKAIEADGHKCFIASRNLRPDDNENYWHNLYEAIEKCSIFLVVSSQQAMLSQDVQREIQHALKLKKPFLEFKVDDAPHTLLFKEAFDGIKWVKGTLDSKQNYHSILSRIFDIKKQIKSQGVPYTPRKLSFLKVFSILAFLGTLTFFVVNFDSWFNTENEPAPILNLVGDNTITLKVGSEFIEPGFTAYDYAFRDLTVTREDNLDVFTPGVYTIRYSVTDDFNQTTTLTRTVIVEDFTFIENVQRADVILTLDVNPTTLIFMNRDLIPFAIYDLELKQRLDLDDTFFTLEEAIEFSVDYALGFFDRADTVLVGISGSSRVMNTVTEIINELPISNNLDFVVKRLNVDVNDYYSKESISVTQRYLIDMLLEHTDINATLEDLIEASPMDILREYLAEDVPNIMAEKMAIANDTIAPVVILNGEEVIELLPGTPFIDPGVIATDNLDDSLEIEVMGSVNINVPGEYRITYQTRDRAGNRSNIVERLVIVLDDTKPILRLIGEAEITLELGTTYDELGAEVVSLLDEAWVINILGSVDTTTLGTYRITYRLEHPVFEVASLVRVVEVVPVPTFRRPNVRIDVENISYGYAHVSTIFTDLDSVIREITIELFQGEDKVQNISQENLSFMLDNLLSNTTYRVAFTILVQSDRESFSTITFEKEFSTLTYSAPTVSIDSIQTTEDSIVFSAIISNPEGIEYSVETVLLDGDNIVETVEDLFDYEFSSLKPNKDYQLVLTISYDLNDGNGLVANIVSESIRTTNLQRPRSSILASNIDFDTVEIKINHTDPDEILMHFSIVLIFENNQLEEYSNLNHVTFAGLASNTEYFVELRATYDLQDGEGPQNYVVEKRLRTLEKASPSISLQNLLVSPTALSFEPLLEDKDNVLVSWQWELRQENSTLKFTDQILLVENLFSNSNYELILILNYDKQDGLGLQEIIYTQDINTPSLERPTLSLSDNFISQEEITVTFSAIDVNQLIISQRIELRKGNVTLEQQENQQEATFTGLQSNTEYQLAFIVTYDLKDGEGLQTANIVQSFTTLAKTNPSLNLEVATSTQNQLTFEVSIFDVDFVGTLSAIELRLDGVLVQEKTDLSSRMFEQLQSNTSYEIIALYRFDLNDGKGTQSISKSAVAVTLAKSVPIVTIAPVDITTTSVAFTVDVDDADAVGALSQIEIFFEGDVVVEAQSLTERVISGLTPDRNYVFKVTYTYNLNDGQGEQFIEQTFSFNTLSQKIPQLRFTENTVGKNSLTFGLDITDPDRIGELHAVTLTRGVIPVSSFSDLTARSVSGLLPKTTYTLTVTYRYTLEGVTEDIIITQDVTTQRWDGQGTQALPYIIETPLEFIFMYEAPNAHFVVANDLDFASIQNYQAFVFNGTLDGAGYTLKNLNYTDNSDTQTVRLGLFARNEGTIKNLRLENISITSDTVASVNAGLLVAENFGTVENVTVSGTVYVDSFGAVNAGGLVGINQGTLKNITGDVTLTAKATGLNHSGGIAGRFSGTLENAHVEGTLSTQRLGNQFVYAGGAVGRIDQGTLKKIVTNVDIRLIGSVIGTNIAGGFAGLIEPNVAMVAMEDIVTLGEIDNFTDTGGVVGRISVSSGSLVSMNRIYTYTTLLSRARLGSVYERAVTILGGEFSAQDIFISSNQVRQINGVNQTETPPDYTVLSFEMTLDPSSDVWLVTIPSEWFNLVQAVGGTLKLTQGSESISIESATQSFDASRWELEDSFILEISIGLLRNTITKNYDNTVE